MCHNEPKDVFGYGTSSINYHIINRRQAGNLKGELHMTVNEILEKYTKGEMTPDEANAALKEVEDNDLFLDPNRNIITQEEFMATTAGDTPDTVNGYGLMDHGVGCLEKVHVVNGKTPDVNMGAETAFVYIAGKCYNLVGDTLVEG